MSEQTTIAQDKKQRGKRKVLVGTVTSNKMKKTIVVRVTRSVRHPFYERVIKSSSSFKAHDEKNEASCGDIVKISECRALSKDKRWRLVEIIRTGEPEAASGEANP